MILGMITSQETCASTIYLNFHKEIKPNKMGLLCTNTPGKTHMAKFVIHKMKSYTIYPNNFIHMTSVHDDIL